MVERKYKIRKTFLLPLTLDVALLFVLMVMSLFTDSHPPERIILVLFFIPFLCFLIEASMREVFIGNEGTAIKRFFKKKIIRWEEIRNVDAVILRKKVYLAVTTSKGFHVISNSYEKFPNLVDDIIGRLDDEKVEERVRNISAHPIYKRSDIVGAWIIAILIAVILYIKIFVA